VDFEMKNKSYFAKKVRVASLQVLFLALLAVVVISCAVVGGDTAKSNEARITEFGLKSAAGKTYEGTIDEAKKTIIIVVPRGTTPTILKKMKTVISLSDGNTVTPATGLAGGFEVHNVLTYKVTPKDGKTIKYEVEVRIAKSEVARIIVFYLGNYPGEIGGTRDVPTITITIPKDTTADQLAKMGPVLTLSGGAKIFPRATESAGLRDGEPKDFIVTAEDGIAKRIYEVTANIVK
jgi:ABC-type Fe3+-hydroxamate transport system substrate-binding protein